MNQGAKRVFTMKKNQRSKISQEYFVLWVNIDNIAGLLLFFADSDTTVPTFQIFVWIRIQFWVQTLVQKVQKQSYVYIV